MQMLMDLGWDGDLTAEERASIDAVAGPKTNWKTDLSGGIQRVAIKHECAPFGNAKARAVVWTFPDPVPMFTANRFIRHRRDLVADYPTYEDRKFYRLPTMYASIQKHDFSKEYPIVSSPPAVWSNMRAAAMNPAQTPGWPNFSRTCLSKSTRVMPITLVCGTASRFGLKGPEGGKVKVMAMVTERVGEGVAFMPFHFGGHFQGEDQRSKYPDGADPYVLGESTNTAQTYGYDSVTQMQESKTTLCKIWSA